MYSSKRFLFLLIYLAIILYGSLIPFQFHFIPWSEAVDRFIHIQYLQLGISSRTDWVSNGILYFPLGVIWGFAEGSRIKKGAGLVFGLLFSGLFAISVEFLQLFFSVRTVSLNDIAAEIIGALIGALICFVFRAKIVRLCTDLRAGSVASINALLIFYMLFALAYSFFPYDFLVSFDEIQTKVTTGRVAWWIIGNGLSVTVLLFLIAEVIFVLPLGVLAYRSLCARTVNIRYALIVLGLIVGLLLEGGQILLVSGSTQGISVFAKASGIVLGGLGYRFLCRSGLSGIRPLIPLLWWLGIPVYVFLLLYSKGVLGDWLTWTEAVDRLNYKMLMPFYFHYYSRETVAFVSCFLNLSLYGVLGGFGAVRTWYVGDYLPSAWRWSVAAIGLSALIEFSRLFIAGRVPDFTNVLLAFIGSWTAFYVTGILLNWPWCSKEYKA